MSDSFDQVASKVAAVTLGFWIIKILATTLGETGGDTVTMTWLKADVMVNAGYLIGSAIFLAALIVLVVIQIAAKKFHPFLYWSVIVASTTAGTAMADFATRSLGIGYTGGSALLFACLMAVLALWYRSQGSISVETVNTPKVEVFYWTAITFSQTLGTALGDWMADTSGLGYAGGALVFASGLALLTAAYYWTEVSRVLLFWAAFILNSTSWCDARRLPRQTVGPGWPGVEPSSRVTGHCDHHGWVHPFFSSKSGKSSASIRTAQLVIKQSQLGLRI